MYTPRAVVKRSRARVERAARCAADRHVRHFKRVATVTYSCTYDDLVDVEACSIMRLFTEPAARLPHLA